MKKRIIIKTHLGHEIKINEPKLIILDINKKKYSIKLENKIKIIPLRSFE